ncbi:MAG: CCA tRNA nucleotidyltransferase [Oscillospiraceae bacterium]
MFKIPSYVDTVLNKIISNGYEAFIVGGCVRDFLLNRTPNDFDITTNATPQQVENIFKDYHVIETGLKHGTVTVVVEGITVEITTYRIDGSYSDSRHPDNVQYTSKLKDDLSRRDFTINAMAYNHNVGIVDEFNGINDLKNGLITCVGNPEKRFSEDALRIMRAIRFSSQLNFSIEENTSKKVHELKDTLKKVSMERIAVELNKLIMGEKPHEILTSYSDVISTIIPEIKPCIKFNQRSRYHKYDVWEHMAMTVQNSPKDLNIRLAMLLHDIGKPKTFTLDSHGNGHFYKHAYVSADITEKVLKNLKYDNATIKRVTTLVRHHDDEFHNVYDIKKSISTLGEDVFFDLISVQQADALSKHEFCSKHVGELEQIKTIAKGIISSGECLTLKQLSLNGNDLKSMGITGKHIGSILNTLLDEILKENLKNDKKSLIEYVKKIG